MANDRRILDGRRVLVADDEPFNLSIIVRMMRELAELGELTVHVDTSALPSFADLDSQSCSLAWKLELLGEIREEDIKQVFEWAEGDCELKIELTGYRWWWKVEYSDPEPAKTVITANEIHIPIGRPVLINTYSQDVIHSFWIPALQGKRDLIPGNPSAIWLQADQPGVFEGQCAEFCGFQHAHMRLVLVAESQEQFQAWLDAQRQPARSPANSTAERGQKIFVSGPCALCHSIRGTDANGHVAPDLTHLAGRLKIAAGTLPNTPGHLAGWIIDSQHIKPGNAMPPTSLSAEDLQALLAYLGGLA